MRITAIEAANIARKNGLTVADAVALRTLADDTATAERIARRFAAESDGRELARAVFGPQPTDDADTDDTGQPPPDTDPDNLAELAHKIFGK